ncbi:MAG: hypothetical protein FWD31_07770 [Planctomycetaceae bacterium]|nr:hypothetical protein [Planctomycetaceae bacterium]
MIPIVISEGKGFDEYSFGEYLTQLCRQHKSEERALAFAFIVYDFANPTIAKILKDEDHWNALDYISGHKLSVFYIDSQNHCYGNRQKQRHSEALRQQEEFKAKNRDMLSFLYPVPMEPTPTDNAIGLIKNVFELDENIKTPFVLFFQIDNHDMISDLFIVGLKQDKLENAFLELRNHIKYAVDSLSEVRKKYPQEIFNLIKTGVENGKFYTFIKTKVIPKLGVETIISFVQLIAGRR